MAEEVGFEPTVGVNPRRFSRPVHSTTLPLLRSERCYTGWRDSERCEITGIFADPRPMSFPCEGRFATLPLRGNDRACND